MTIVLHPADILERPTVEVRPTDRHRLDVAADLLIELGNDERAAAVAAPQIGSTMKMYAFRDPRTGALDVAVNPRIVQASGDQIGREGCLSLPDRWFMVKRPMKVVVACETLEGDPVKHRWSGFQARLAAHEIDHLNGVLITSRGRELK